MGNVLKESGKTGVWVIFLSLLNAMNTELVGENVYNDTKNKLLDFFLPVAVSTEILYYFDIFQFLVGKLQMLGLTCVTHISNNSPKHKAPELTAFFLL